MLPWFLEAMLSNQTELAPAIGTTYANSLALQPAKRLKRWRQHGLCPSPAGFSCCACCAVRGDLIRILGKLMKRKNKFDAIMIETTGLADPAPVAQTFFVDEDLKQVSEGRKKGKM